MNLAFQCKVELFKRGLFEQIPLHVDKDIDIFYFSPKQLKALELLTDNVTTNIGYGGGAFSGKSLLECYWIVLSCMAYPGTGWGLGRNTITNLNQTVLLTLFKILDAEGFISEVDYKYRGGSTNKLTFANGSDIFMVHMAYKPSDPLYTRFGGFELTGCAIDESNENTNQAIGTLFTRLGRRKNYDYGIKKKQLETFNPDKGHIYRRFYYPWTKGEERDSKKFIRALPADNPHPSVPEYIKDIVELGDNVLIERLIKGNFEFDDDPKLLIKQDALNDLWSNTHVREGEIRIVADIAGQGRDLTVVKAYKGLRCVGRRTEKKSTKHTAKELILKVKEEFHCPTSRILIDGNGIGGEVADIMPGTQRFIGNSKAKPKYQKGFFGNLKDQCGYMLAEMINEGLMHYDIKDNMDGIKQEYSCLKYKEMGDKPKKLIPKEEMKELLGNKSPDDMDCDLMLMYFELKQDLSANPYIR